MIEALNVQYFTKKKKKHSASIQCLSKQRKIKDIARLQFCSKSFCPLKEVENNSHQR